MSTNTPNPGRVVGLVDTRGGVKIRGRHRAYAPAAFAAPPLGESVPAAPRFVLRYRDRDGIEQTSPVLEGRAALGAYALGLVGTIPGDSTFHVSEV